MQANNITDTYDFLEELRLAISSFDNRRASKDNGNASKTNGNASNGIHTVYSRFQRVLTLFLDERTADTQIIFAGPFAKMDYLLKEHHAKWNVVKGANDARARIRKSSSIDDASLQVTYLADFRSLCLFISCVDGKPVPDNVRKLFPQGQQTARIDNRVLGDCVRMIVGRWDDTYVYGEIDGFPEEGGSKVNYVSGNRNFPFDWSYLKKMFYDGAQINIVRPHIDKEGIIFPELIILEPDYLINVTTIAKCFTQYADSPLISLINKIKPAQDSQAILLGEFASQMLDEELHGAPWSDDMLQQEERYKQSVVHFFKDNALAMLTTDIDSRLFHEDARKQMMHIHKALTDVLPRSVAHFDKREGIVEPTFFSEMLGLQGRMDFLQTDYSFLIEQKSGKGAFPYNGFETPTWTEEHFVQLQLYMLVFRYNYRDKYAAGHYDLSPMLLYSKYENSLLRMGMMPEEVFRAIKIRNGIAWLEMHLTKPNAYHLLDTLTPQKLNKKQTTGKLWTAYQLPALTSLLSRIHNASDLERDYFFRFMTFISNEQMMSKLGNKTKECSGFASTWHDSLQEKKLAGNIYDRLQLAYPTAGTQGEISYVDLKFADDIDNDMSNFRRGDIVILYPYDKDKEPDATRTMVMRCTIKDITQDNHVVLNLRHPQSDNRIFRHGKGKVWAIEHDFMEASYTGLYRGMYAFLAAPKERRDLLLFQREPQIDKGAKLKGDYGSFNELALRVKRANDFFLIIGPPGTGKTSYGLLNTLKEELLEENSSVLLMSFTNRAVDEICSKLCEAGIDFIRIGGDMTASPEYKGHLITQRVAKIGNLNDVKEMLKRNRVYVGTTTAISSHLNIFQLKHFDLAIIDEASQILEPHLMGILSACYKPKGSATDAGPAIRKFVMIGDHKQLPAVVQQSPQTSEVHSPLLRGIMLDDCRLSLFERLLKRYHDNKDVVYMLTRQGRMHPDISDFPNKAFYNGKLKAVPLPHQSVTLPRQGAGRNGIEDMLRTRRIAFISCPKPDDAPSEKVNPVEAEIIAATVHEIYRIEGNAFSTEDTVGVIVPYRNQIAAIRKAIDRYGISRLHDIPIDTVERFQGSQRRYIIYGFTIQKPYQLRFLTSNVFEDVDGTVVDRKLNVAMTRAEEHLIMTGYEPLLRTDAIFSKLIDFVKGRHGYFSTSVTGYVNGQFVVPPLP